MSQSECILVVDDEPDIREPLCEHLERNGFVTRSAENARDARTQIMQGDVDLVVLDVMMPGESGLTLCRSLAETGTIPVILLTALADETDRIVGLEIGADDYLAKPFNPRELVARIRSVLRRTRNPSVEPGVSRFINFGGWTFDRARAELSDSRKVIVSLSTGEAQLLGVFIDHVGQTLSRDDIFKLTKGRDAHPFERSLDNMISRLRRKIEPDPSAPTHIQTVWGGGYRFLANG